MGWEQRNADFCKAQTDAQMAYIEAEREVDQLQDENAKLVMKLNAEHLVRQNVERENAKLRELVRDMYACISHANEQDWFYFERDKFGCGMSCTVNGEACGLCALADRMRELGVQP